MAFYRLSKLPFASPQTLQNPPKPSKPSKTLQTLQTPSPAGTPGPRPLPEQAPQGQGHSNGFLWAFKAAVCQPANPPKPSKPSTRPQHTPQGQGHFPNRHPRAKATAMAFYGLSKLPFASPQTLQNPPNPPNTVPSRHPRAKATSRTGTPGPRPQQWLSMGFQSCRLPARKRSKTLQTPSPAGTPGPRPLPEQAPQGQGHSNGFLWAFKAAVCQPANPPKPSKPSKPPQGQGHSNGFLWAFKAAVCQPANAPNPSKIPNTFPNRHPRAKATSRTGAPGPRPQQWLSIGFQSCRLPARKPSKTLQNPPKPSKPSKHRPQQAPQGQGHFPNRHPRAKATAMAFYRLSKLPFASPQTLQNPPNPPNTVPSRHPRAKATSRTGTPGPRPQQWLSMGFQSCRLPARKRSKPSKTLQSLQTLQNPPNPPNTFQNPPNPPKPSKPSKHLPQQAPQCQGHFSNRRPRVCQPSNP